MWGSKFQLPSAPTSGKGVFSQYKIKSFFLLGFHPSVLSEVLAMLYPVTQSQHYQLAPFFFSLQLTLAKNYSAEFSRTPLPWNYLWRHHHTCYLHTTCDSQRTSVKPFEIVCWNSFLTYNSLWKQHLLSSQVDAFFQTHQRLYSEENSTFGKQSFLLLFSLRKLTTWYFSYC